MPLALLPVLYVAILFVGWRIESALTRRRHERRYRRRVSFRRNTGLPGSLYR